MACLCRCEISLVRCVRTSPARSRSRPRIPIWPRPSRCSTSTIAAGRCRPPSPSTATPFAAWIATWLGSAIRSPRRCSTRVLTTLTTGWAMPPRGSARCPSASLPALAGCGWMPMLRPNRSVRASCRRSRRRSSKRRGCRSTTSSSRRAVRRGPCHICCARSRLISPTCWRKRTPPSACGRSSASLRPLRSRCGVRWCSMAAATVCWPITRW